MSIIPLLRNSIAIAASVLLLGFALMAISTDAVAQKSPRPQWVGKGKHRILVRVDPVKIGKRPGDELPTRLHLSNEVLRAATGASQKIDVASIQVGQYNPTTGQPIKYGKWAYATKDWERPSRWYDDSIPEDFPEVLNSINPETGELAFINVRNWGYLNETLGEWECGTLAWLHTQQGNNSSYYAIYFDLLPLGKSPDVMPRTGYLGDGTERVTEIGPTTHGLFSPRVEVADWNGDGLFDLLVGFSRGGLIWFPNRGTTKQPRFPYPKLVHTADGKPLDVGFTSAPTVMDWDGDGISDLVCGVEWNRLVWYKNIGTNASPRLEYKGLIRVDGQPFSLPFDPVPETPGIYKTDYHPVITPIDWDADGDLDILAGGFVTGRIYLFTNEGRGDDKQPILKSRGAIEADGQPLDTSWCASPTMGDFDGDGDLDLITGAMVVESTGGEVPSRENFLLYFENIGDAKNPTLTRRPFPLKEEFPPGRAATPRTADLNGDGLLDLAVSEGRDLYLFLNVGTGKAPKWQISPPLPGHWNTDALAWLMWGVISFDLMDWNHDGHLDVVSEFTVQLNQGRGNPQLFSKPQSFVVQQKIHHKSPTGDQWTFTKIVDMDSDGHLDILYGVHEGYVYLHRKLGGAAAKFDAYGVRLHTEDGKPIRVGLHPGTWDFDVLQGARTTQTAADFDRDGKIDLIVGDTYGYIRFYRNLTGGTNPTFALPVVVAELKTRVVPAASDWNEDGWPDILLGGGRINILLNTGRRQGPRFLPVQPIEARKLGDKGATTTLEPVAGSSEWRPSSTSAGAGLYLPFESVVSGVDWNGDGDIDLMANATYGYLCWFERSFLEHGYAPAHLIGFQ